MSTTPDSGDSPSFFDRILEVIEGYGSAFSGPILDVALACSVFFFFFAGTPVEETTAFRWAVFVAFLKIAQAINNLAAAVKTWATASRMLGIAANN